MDKGRNQLPEALQAKFALILLGLEDVLRRPVSRAKWFDPLAQVGCHEELCVHLFDFIVAEHSFRQIPGGWPSLFLGITNAPVEMINHNTGLTAACVEVRKGALTKIEQAFTAGQDILILINDQTRIIDLAHFLVELDRLVIAPPANA